MKGLHLVGDLSGCQCDPAALRHGVDFEAKCTEMVRTAGLEVIGTRFHQFDGGGFTGAVLLAESHVAVHTWPDRAGVTLDVYVAQADPANAERATRLFDALAAHFAPAETARCALERGQPGEIDGRRGFANAALDVVRGQHLHAIASPASGIQPVNSSR